MVMESARGLAVAMGRAAAETEIADGASLPQEHLVAAGRSKWNQRQRRSGQ